MHEFPQSAGVARRAGCRGPLAYFAIGIAAVALFIIVPILTNSINHLRRPEALPRVNPKDGAQMVFIPAGEFTMGDDETTGNPTHTARLSGFWIYNNDVTVKQYKKFCQETKRRM